MRFLQVTATICNYTTFTTITVVVVGLVAVGAVLVADIGRTVVAVGTDRTGSVGTGNH